MSCWIVAAGNVLPTQCSEWPFYTTIRDQSEQLHSRAELIGIHVDVPLCDLNAGMASQGSQQPDIDTPVGQSGDEGTPAGMAAGP